MRLLSINLMEKYFECKIVVRSIFRCFRLSFSSFFSLFGQHSTFNIFQCIQHTHQTWVHVWVQPTVNFINVLYFILFYIFSFLIPDFLSIAVSCLFHPPSRFHRFNFDICKTAAVVSCRLYLVSLTILLSFKCLIPLIQIICLSTIYVCRHNCHISTFPFSRHISNSHISFESKPQCVKLPVLKGSNSEHIDTNSIRKTKM